ncbi:MAG: hypothetical protein JST84_05370 [Acidobacteria bacterium]|nr:hypothetical protein [Acidobacteriota bacterium]
MINLRPKTPPPATNGIIWAVTSLLFFQTVRIGYLLWHANQELFASFLYYTAALAGILFLIRHRKTK